MTRRRKWRPPTTKLRDIQRYLSLAFSPPGTGISIGLLTADEQASVDVYSDRGLVSVRLYVEIGSPLEARLLAFLSAHRLATARESDVRPQNFSFPNLPVQRGYRILPDPLDPEQLAWLLSAFFQDVCGLEEDSVLTLDLPSGMPPGILQ